MGAIDSKSIENKMRTTFLVLKIIKDNDNYHIKIFNENNILLKVLYTSKKSVMKDLKLKKNKYEIYDYKSNKIENCEMICELLDFYIERFQTILLVENSQSVSDPLTHPHKVENIENRIVKLLSQYGYSSEMNVFILNNKLNELTKKVNELTEKVNELENEKKNNTTKFSDDLIKWEGT